jgi:plastocyanin
MRFLGFAMVSALVLGACGGNDAATDGSVAMDTTAVATTEGGAAGATGAMAPVTGNVVEVKMIGDEKGFRFEPENITIKQGDGVRFLMVNGAPHNVAFDAATLSADAKAALIANMPDQQSELASKYYMTAGEGFTMSFAGVPAGTYTYVCVPHLPMNMKGTITVQ